MKRALAVAAIALVIPAPATAHVTVTPSFVEAGVETELAFATPNERPPHATTEVRATAPPGVSVISASAPPGWRATVDGPTVTWSGGRLEDRTATPFPVRILARSRAGTYAFTATQSYDDGATVRWKADFTVLPAAAAAPKQHPWGAVGAALAGIVVIAGSLIGLRFLRRRPLQEQ